MLYYLQISPEYRESDLSFWRPTMWVTYRVGGLGWPLTSLTLSTVVPKMQTFSDHPGWADVVPVAQDDGPNAIVTIAYTPNCKHLVVWRRLLFLWLGTSLMSTLTPSLWYYLVRKLMDLFRAVLKSGELSERVLELTEEILDENAANYTVW